METWVELLQNDEVFTESSLEIMKRMKDIGGEATCKQLRRSTVKPQLLQCRFFVAGPQSCQVHKLPRTYKNTENSKWWPILT